VPLLDCHEEGPPSVTRSGCHQGAISKEAHVQCCTPDWISAERSSASAFPRGGRASRRAGHTSRRRLAAQARPAHRRGPQGARPRGCRVDDRRPAWSTTPSSRRARRSRSPTPRRSRDCPVACKTDKIDSLMFALARFRLHLVKHNSMLKHRVHSTLVNLGRPCPVTDLFGVEGRRLLERLEAPEPWRGNVAASVALIGDLERQIAEANCRLKAGHADHPYIPLRCRGSAGCSPSRSPPRSARSPVSPRPGS
jgi:hypothetical protein